MTFQLELMKNIKDPYAKFYQLKIAEAVPVHLGKIALLLLVSLVVALIRAFFALDTVMISPLLTEYTTSEFELMKVLIGLGGVLDAIVSPIIYLLFISFCFWAFLDEVSFRQTLVVTTVSLFILIIGKVALLPFELALGIQSAASPFALGVLLSLITDNQYIIQFFGGISIFLIAAILMQIYAYSVIASHKKRFIILITIATHMPVLFVSVFKTFIGIYLTL